MAAISRPAYWLVHQFPLRLLPYLRAHPRCHQTLMSTSYLLQMVCSLLSRAGVYKGCPNDLAIWKIIFEVPINSSVQCPPRSFMQLRNILALPVPPTKR
ncbi:hypothetical protein DFJ58DRAFT_917242 [Suillus subalutaceus]|uniref:uncharacterized protein n=1 Tax=Suillus subalutaceus TaxID=48586 RepID=UPI001B8657BE|nr:uncharacterized protein DFJ58DRAFT_917242 [Suillus subalutaceus]KAG1838142.1 hypothetical protein DFJ58DRAFT_917242 [Suillus subalutaceus]